MVSTYTHVFVTQLQSLWLLILQGDQSYQIGHSEPQNFLRCENGSSRDRSAIVHNFQMVENAAELLGIAPEVNLQSVCIMLVCLSLSFNSKGLIKHSFYYRFFDYQIWWMETLAQASAIL